MRLRKNKEVRKEVLRRAGRYHEVTDHLEFKEVRVGEHRYVVCHNPEEEIRDRLRREEIIEHTRQELQTKGPKAFVMPRGIRRYIELNGGELKLKEKVIKEDARYDGKWVLRTNTELPAEEVALAYKSLWRIERTFRELKSGLEVNPVYSTYRRPCPGSYCGLLPGTGTGSGLNKAAEEECHTWTFV